MKLDKKFLKKIFLIMFLFYSTGAIPDNTLQYLSILGVGPMPKDFDFQSFAPKSRHHLMDIFSISLRWTCRSDVMIKSSVGATTFSITTLSITTFSITTLSTMGTYVTLSMHYARQKH